VGILFALPLVGYARSAPDGECTFLGLKISDRVGASSAQPDGKPDAVFALSLGTAAADPKVTEIQLRASGTSAVWTSGGRTSGAGYMGVALAKNPSDVLNKKPGPLNIVPSQENQFLLLVTDDGGFSEPQRQYQVRVTYSNGTAWTAPVKFETVSTGQDAPRPPGAFPVRMTAVLKGISNYDAVSPGKKIGGDDKGDGLFVLTVEAQNREITGIEIRNVDGTQSVWDTVPSSPNAAIGVAEVSDPSKLLNSRDTTVRIKVKDRVDLNLYVADNGSIAAGNTTYRITVTFADGGISWCPVQKAADGATEGATRPTVAAAATVNFLGTWLGFVSTDAVGQYPDMKPDGKADAVFGLDIEVSPKSFVTGIEITTLDGISKRWATAGIAGTAWGLGVAYQTAPSALINRPDGSVRIPIEGRAQFYLYAADPGDLATSSETLRAIIHLADGSAYQQFVRKPLASTPTVMPGADDLGKARGIITCEFRGFIADLVNTSTRPGKDGYLDGTFIMKLQVDDKKLARVDIKAGDGAVRWSSDPRPPTMFLGMALYPKIYVLVNQKGGLLGIPISGRRTIYLYAADNGLLSDPKSRLTVTVTFDDKTTLAAEVIK